MEVLAHRSRTKIRTGSATWLFSTDSSTKLDPRIIQIWEDCRDRACHNLQNCAAAPKVRAVISIRGNDAVFPCSACLDADLYGFLSVVPTKVNAN